MVGNYRLERSNPSGSVSIALPNRPGMARKCDLAGIDIDIRFVVEDGRTYRSVSVIETGQWSDPVTSGWIAAPARCASGASKIHARVDTDCLPSYADQM